MGHQISATLKNGKNEEQLILFVTDESGIASMIHMNTKDALRLQYDLLSSHFDEHTGPIRFSFDSGERTFEWSYEVWTAAFGAMDPWYEQHLIPNYF